MSWINPSVVTHRLTLLNASEFAALCNALLAGIVRSAGLPVSGLSVTLRINDPDGGLDGTYSRSSIAVGRIVGAGSTGYQYKSGTTKRTAKVIARQDILQKPRVAELLRAGGTFVYMTAVDYGVGFEEEVAHEVNQLGLEVDTSQIKVLAAHTLSHLLVSHPALLGTVLGLPDNVETFGQWSGRETMSNAYVAGSAEERRLEDLRRSLRAPSSRTRIVGSPGDGKTRTTLEALRGTELESAVLYVAQPAHLSASLINFLRTTPDIECVLVVDEVDVADAAELLDRFSTMPSGVRLVMIGVDPLAGSDLSTLRIEGLGDETLRAIVEAIVPGIPGEAVQEIVGVCERSPKLAVLLAGRVRVVPELSSHAARLRDPTIRNVLTRYLRLDPPEWNALAVVCLFERLGWTHEAENESVVAYEALGYDPIQCRRLIDQLHERYGIVPLAGRMRYVSPRILGDHFASRMIESWTAEVFRRFISALSSQMLQSFARRLRGLSGAIRNAYLVEEVILGDQGPFRGLPDLATGGASTLVRHLAAPFRRATLRMLQRVFASSTDKELSEQTEIRRDLVWALEELVWASDTFAGASRLMLRLAANETEEIANSATGLWIETFHPMLGRTAAGSEARLAVLRDSLGADEPASRALAVRAIGHALRISMISRMGGPPRSVEGMPQEAWRPSTWGEVWDLIGTYLHALVPMVQDPDAEVRDSAVEAIAEGIEAAIKYPRVLESWTVAAEALVGKPFGLRAPVLKALDRWFERMDYDDEQRAEAADLETTSDDARNEMNLRVMTLRELFPRLLGDDFESRFRWLLSSDPWDLHHAGSDSPELTLDQRLAAIADEVIGDPGLLANQMDWLLEVPTHLPEEWMGRLGAVDVERRLWPLLLEVSRRHKRGVGWLSLYSLADSNGGGASPASLERIESISAEGAGTPQVVDLLIRAGYSADRANRLIELIRAGHVGAGDLRRLAFSPWRNGVPLEVVSALVDEFLTVEGGPEAAVHYLWIVVREDAATASVLGGSIVKVLRLTIGQDGMWHRLLDEWADLAMTIAPIRPEETCELCLDLLNRTESVHTDRIVEVLRGIWGRGNKTELFEKYFAKLVGQGGIVGFRLRLALERFPFHEVDIGVLLKWVEEEPDTRAEALAKVLGAPAGRPTDLEGELLERYGERGVEGAFISDLITGTWWGSGVDRINGLLARVATLAEDERPAVRRYAASATEVLQSMLASTRQREEEERFF